METTQNTQVQKMNKIEIPKISGYTDELKWLVRAIGKDENKEVLNYIHVTPTELVACDACRLHQLKEHELCETLEEGLYRFIDLKRSIILEKIDKELIYPSVTSLIPEKEQLTQITRTLKSDKVIDTFGLNDKKTISVDLSTHLFTLSKYDVSVDYSLLRDTLEGDTFSVYVDNAHPSEKPMLIENKTKLAVIMPLRRY